MANHGLAGVDDGSPAVINTNPDHDVALKTTPWRACLAASALTPLLSGCGIVSTTVMVTGAAVGVATTAAGVAVDGAILVGKGVVKTGEVIVETVAPETAGKSAK
jgi:hypothetical protein